MAPSSRALARPLPPPPSYYSCSHCGAHFASLQALGGHKSIHSSKRRGTADVSVDAKRLKKGASPASPSSKRASPKADTWRPSREGAGAGVGSSIRGQLLELLDRQGLAAAIKPGLPSAWEYPSFPPTPALSSTLPHNVSPSHVSGLCMDPWAMAAGWQGAVGPTAVGAATAGWEFRPHPHPVGGQHVGYAVARRRPVKGMQGGEGSEVINLSPRDSASAQGLGSEGGSRSRGASSSCHDADVGHSAAWAKVLLAGAARKLQRFAEAQGVVPRGGPRSPVSQASSGVASAGASPAIESQGQSRIAPDTIHPSFGRDTKSAGTRSPSAPTTLLFPGVLRSALIDSSSIMGSKAPAAGVQSQTVINRLSTFDQACSEDSEEEENLEEGSLLQQTQAPSHSCTASAPEDVTLSRVVASAPLGELNLLKECSFTRGDRSGDADSTVPGSRKASAGVPCGLSGSLTMLFDSLVSNSHVNGLKVCDVDLSLRL